MLHFAQQRNAKLWFNDKEFNSKEFEKKLLSDLEKKLEEHYVKNAHEDIQDQQKQDVYGQTIAYVKVITKTLCDNVLSRSRDHILEKRKIWLNGLYILYILTVNLFLFL